MKPKLILPTLLLALAASSAAAPSSRVTVIRTPDRGIQPQAAIDRNGVVHLIYYQGDPGGGDIFYVPVAGSYSSAVESQPSLLCPPRPAPFR